MFRGRKKLFLLTRPLAARPNVYLMKKIVALLAFSAFIQGCDDGDLTVENIDFTTQTAAHCGNIVYKLKDTEAFFFEVADHDALFINDATPEGSPRTLPVNSTNRIFYRAYSGDIDDDVLCSSIPPATPSVVEEWTFTGDNGRIEVTTSPVIIANTELSGGEIIQKYRHDIVFRAVNKNTPGGTEFGDFTFGSYFTPANTLPFNFDDTAESCSNLVYNLNGSEAITLAISPELIANEVTPVGTPRTALLGTITNVLTYTLFQSAVTSDYFCVAPTPTTPLIREQWLGDAGVLNVSGTIEVTTTSSGPGVFQHEIRLKNATFRKGNSAFKLADNYLLGFLTTS